MTPGHKQEIERVKEQDMLTAEQRAELQAEIDRVEARMERALARVRRSEAVLAHYRHHFYGG